MQIVFRLTILSILLSCCNFLPFRHFLLEVNSSLGAYYLTVHLLSLLWFIVFRKQYSGSFFRLACLLLVFLITNYALVVTAYWKTPTPKTRASDFSELSIYYSNVNKNTGDPHRLNKDIVQQSPDLVALLEVDEEWLSHLSVLKDYPYSVVVPRIDLFGVALYSKIPFVDGVVDSVGSDMPPVIIAPLQTAVGEMLVLLVHAIPPLSTENFEHSWILMRRLQTLLRFEKRPILVVGDFNSTPFGRLFRGFRKSGYVPAELGFGISRTWNAHSPFLRLKLDHMLTRGTIEIADFQVMEKIGSDHFPLFGRFRVHAPAVKFGNENAKE